jgi:hypothetical protein
MKSKAAVTWLVMAPALAVFAGCRDSALTTPRSSDAGVAVTQRGGIIAADCIVTFFSDRNDGVYFSTQRHRIDPESKAIVINAREPQGEFSWRLWAGGYQTSIPPAGLDTAPAAVIDRDVVRAIVTCFAASAGYYDLGSEQQPDMVKIDGRWYRPLELPRTKEDAPRVTLYLVPNEGRIDMVRVASAAGDRVVTAHGYNNRWLKEAGRYVPTKIDVFAGVPDAAQADRILQVNYQSFEMSK